MSGLFAIISVVYQELQRLAKIFYEKFFMTPFFIFYQYNCETKSSSAPGCTFLGPIIHMHMGANVSAWVYMQKGIAYMFGLFWLGWVWLGLVWFGLVWVGLIWFSLIVFFGISTLVGYLISNPVHIYIYIYIYILTSTGRLFHSIRTLQCG